MPKKSATLATLLIGILLLSSLTFGAEIILRDFSKIKISRLPQDKNPSKRIPSFNDACVELEVNIDPEVVCCGDYVAVTLWVKNCSENKERIELDFEVSFDDVPLAIGPKITTYLPLKGGEEYTVAYVPVIPCVGMFGTVEVEAVAYVKGQEKARASDEFEVIDCD